MTLSRRSALRFLAAAPAIGLAPAAAGAASAARNRSAAPAPPYSSLQVAIDRAARDGQPVMLPPGVTVTAPLVLRPGTVLTGSGPSTRLVIAGAGPALSAHGAGGIRLADFAIDASAIPRTPDGAVIALDGCGDLAIDGVAIHHAPGNGFAVSRSTGRIERCRVSHAGSSGLFALDSRLTITGNDIEHCGDNGILVWRSAVGEDGSQVTGNRVSTIRADSGGSGQNGNGINVFRAGGVLVSGNALTDCAYSAVRGNTASNLTVVGNTCLRSGEVALYAEFGFEGALLSANIIDRAATGISVTNFDAGGRLCVVHGNLVRNLFLRTHEPVDTRGHGITVEADAAVSGNTIEGAPAAGIVLGWGHHMRDLAVTGNVIRGSRSGILVSSERDAGPVLIASNLISGATEGAIRAHDHGRAHGPDLARTPGPLAAAPDRARVVISGNTTG